MWSSSSKVFFLMALMAITAITIVQGDITCYNCDSDDHADCDEVHVSPDRVELCKSKYSWIGMEPVCRRIVTYTYPVPGEEPVYHLAYRGCTHVRKSAREKCEDNFGANWKSTTCWCKTNLCNR